jgi:hypothetical protein
MHQDVQRYCILALTVLLSVPGSDSRADGESNTISDDHQSQESFVQYRTEGRMIIVAKPLEKVPIENPAFEDYVHVVVACTLALVLATLLGFFIRHYGLTLPAFSRSERSNANRGAPGDAENDPQMTASQGLAGIGFDKWAKMDESDLPEKPAAVHLKWG